MAEEYFIYKSKLEEKEIDNNKIKKYSILSMAL
jgi:hypothetical protein